MLEEMQALSGLYVRCHGCPLWRGARGVVRHPNLAKPTRFFGLPVRWALCEIA